MELVHGRQERAVYIKYCCRVYRIATITKTIRKHQVRFERFERLDLKLPWKVARNKDYILNEQQATLLVTFLKNTEQVANFKTNLMQKHSLNA